MYFVVRADCSNIVTRTFLFSENTTYLLHLDREKESESERNIEDLRVTGVREREQDS